MQFESRHDNWDRCHFDRRQYRRRDFGVDDPLLPARSIDERVRFGPKVQKMTLASTPSKHAKMPLEVAVDPFEQSLLRCPKQHDPPW
jgi:hypothetical protein